MGPHWNALSLHWGLLLLLMLPMMMILLVPASSASVPGDSGDELSVALKFTLDLPLSKTQEDAIVRYVPVECTVAQWGWTRCCSRVFT